jgi:hypothetical protein
VEIWLSPKLPALGEDSVSGSVCNIIDTLVEFGLALPSNVDKNKRATIMIYTTWNIWNERNHMRIFLWQVLYAVPSAATHQGRNGLYTLIRGEKLYLDTIELKEATMFVERV